MNAFSGKVTLCYEMNLYIICVLRQSSAFLPGSMMVDLEEKVSQLENWTDAKGLIVQGAAGTFCSGSDLNAVRAISNSQVGQ